MNRDFAEMLSALSAEGVEFLVVGGYALFAHGYLRYTGDIDIWVRPSAENAPRVLRALRRFGAPTFELSERDLTANDTVFQIGVAPSRIDILTGIEAVDFDEAWGARISGTVEGVPVQVLGRAQLLRNKKAVGRPKDLLDVTWLEENPEEPPT